MPQRKAGYPFPFPWRLFFLTASATAAATATAKTTDDSCDAVPDPSKVDCGELGTEQDVCEKMGCCWKEVQSPSSDVPWCYYKSGEGPTCPLSSPFLGERDDQAPFSSSEVVKMRSFFLKNINIKNSGAVVAAPDHNTPGGNYYYHWERDGALSMGALLETTPSLADIKDEMDAYVGWVKGRQQASDPHGQSVLAEPKYEIPSGDVFAGPWCRPQNDGPGLRAKTLIAYAEALQQEVQNSSGTTAADLWPLIQTDLDWVASNWQANGCDLWEEIRSDDFFWNRFTMRAALSLGASFAKKQGNASAAQSYSSAASAIESTLASHFQDGFVYETAERKKDAAVITAFNDGYLGDNVFGPLSKEVAGTISTLNDLFCPLFDINMIDTHSGIPGVLLGRYEGDIYAGGNPWILLTSALAELLYRGASDALNAPNNTTFDYWAPVLGLEKGDLTSTASLADALAGAADGVLVRLRHHVQDAGFHLDEQLDRTYGNSIAAKDLTWSYATTLKAMYRRAQYSTARSRLRNKA